MNKLYFESDEVRKIVNETLECIEYTGCSWHVLSILRHMKDKIDQLTEYEKDMRFEILGVFCDSFVKI